MARVIHYSTRAKKDLKLYRNDVGKMNDLFRILQCLASENEIPAQYKPHKLIGNYKGCWECHVQNDFLLIWIDEKVVEIVRVGSHSELYR